MKRLFLIFYILVILVLMVYCGWALFDSYKTTLTACQTIIQPYCEDELMLLLQFLISRYFAICHTMDFKLSKKACKIIVFCIWIIAATIMIPWAIYYQIGRYPTPIQNLTLCYENWPNGEAGQRSYFLGAIFLCCYSVPLVLIVACYFLIGAKVWRRRAPGEKISTSNGVVQKSKVKAVKMLCIVVVMFGFSWLPLYVIRLWSLYGSNNNKELQRIVRDIINPIAQWLGSSNSGMNPIIYCFFSKRYRRGFKDTITSCWKSRGNRIQRRNLATAMAVHTYINGTPKTTKSYLYTRGNSDHSLSADSNKVTSYV